VEGDITALIFFIKEVGEMKLSDNSKNFTLTALLIVRTGGDPRKPGHGKCEAAKRGS